MIPGWYQEVSGGRHADVDYIFDAPAMLTESLTGYRYDGNSPEWDKRPFEVLVETSASQSPNGERRILEEVVRAMTAADGPSPSAWWPAAGI